MKGKKVVFDIAKISMAELVRLAKDLKFGQCGRESIKYSGVRSAILPLLKEISILRHQLAEQEHADYFAPEELLRWSTWDLLKILTDGTSPVEFMQAWELTRDNLVVNARLHDEDLRLFANSKHLPEIIADEVLAACARLYDFAEGEVYRLSADGKNPHIRQKIEKARIERAPKHFHGFEIGSVAITEQPYSVAVGSVRLVTYQLYRGGGIGERQIEVPREIFYNLGDYLDFVLQVWLDPSGALQTMILETQDECDCCRFAGEEFMFRNPVARPGSHDVMLAIALSTEALFGAEKIADLIRRHREEAERRLTTLTSYRPIPQTT